MKLHSYPRAAGKWRQALRWMKLAWKRGQDTEMVEGQLCTVEFGKCPVCGDSVHTGQHVATLKAKDVLRNE